MISYLWVSHSLYLLIALGLCHHCHYFMPFCFPYTFDCFWRIFKFSLHQDSDWVATTYPKLSLNTHILSFCRWLFSLARLQVVASKLLEIWLFLFQIVENVSIHTLMSLYMNLGTLVIYILLQKHMYLRCGLVCMIMMHWGWFYSALAAALNRLLI